MWNLTLMEASQQTGVSAKALRRWTDRGTLRSSLDQSGRRRIQISELERVGLSGPDSSPSGGSTGHASDTGSPGDPRPSRLDLSPLLDRLEALAAENGKLRFLEARAGSLERELHAERSARERAEAALFETRARLQVLEPSVARRRPWWRRSRSSERNGVADPAAA